MENKHEIIEHDAVAKQGFWQKAKSKIMGMTTKQLVFLALGLVVLSGVGMIAAEVFDNQLEIAEDKVERQLGLEQDLDDKIVTIPSSTNTATNTSQTAPTTSLEALANAYGVNLVDKSELDGTYTATAGNDQYTLTVKGNQATLVELDTDGEQDLEQIIFDLDKKLAYVDGEAESYTLEGNNLTLTELDKELFNQQDSLTFTKQ